MWSRFRCCRFYVFPRCPMIIKRRVLSISYLRYHVGWTFFSGTVLRRLCDCMKEVE
ncbi:hypothetical protein Hanom_Chr11g01009421 [Helianthus anomalus]